MEEVRKYFEDSIDRAEQDSEQKPQDENALCVTTNYNLGRIYKGLFICDKAFPALQKYKETFKGSTLVFVIFFIKILNFFRIS